MYEPSAVFSADPAGTSITVPRSITLLGTPS